jgi:hypothetical protein
VSGVSILVSSSPSKFSSLRYASLPLLAVSDILDPSCGLCPVDFKIKMEWELDTKHPIFDFDSNPLFNFDNNALGPDEL